MTRSTALAITAGLGVAALAGLLALGYGYEIAAKAYPIRLRPPINYDSDRFYADN